MIDRVIIIDPRLCRHGGHHYGSTSELHHAVRRLGISSVVLVHQNCDQAIIEELDAKPTFAYHLHSKVNVPSGYELVMQWLQRNRLFENELHQVGAMNLSDKDLIILYTSNEMNLFGMYQWYNNLNEPRPKIAVTIHNPEFSKNALDRPVHHELLRKSLRVWSKFPSGGVLVGATNLNLANYINKMADVNAVHMPPIIKKSEIIQEKLNNGPGLTVLFPGDLRLEKGHHLLLDTIKAHSSQLGQFQFVIQVANNGDYSNNVANSFREEGVSVVRGALTGHDYIQMLRRADATLVFYHPFHYSRRVSGVFDESIAMGLPVITTRGTTMAHRLAELQIPGVVAEDWTTDSLFKALLELSDNYPALKDATVRAANAPGWQGGDKFMEFVLDRLV